MQTLRLICPQSAGPAFALIRIGRANPELPFEKCATASRATFSNSTTSASDSKWTFTVSALGLTPGAFDLNSLLLEAGGFDDFVELTIEARGALQGAPVEGQDVLSDPGLFPRERKDPIAVLTLDPAALGHAG